MKENSCITLQKEMDEKIQITFGGWITLDYTLLIRACMVHTAALYPSGRLLGTPSPPGLVTQ